jgi:cellulose synthase/poly-beta-1,6-N-acetylglucosamine synthase-like glycosyltransferase
MGGQFLGAVTRAYPIAFPARLPPSDAVADDTADRWTDASRFPEITGWQPVLDMLGIGPPAAIRAASSARLQGTRFEAELVAGRLASEAELFRTLAVVLAVPFAAVLDPGRIIIRDQDCLALLDARGAAPPLRVDDGEGRTVWAVSPDGSGIERLRALVRRRPEEARRVWIVAPRTVRAALLERARPLLAAQARNGLFERFPALSARIVGNAWQGGLLGATAMLAALAAILAPVFAWSALHGLGTFVFLACVGLRVAVIRAPAHVAPPDFAGLRLDTLPVYSVLVALHREAAVVPQLLAALDALVWPRGKLEVKLVCEADDDETLQAIRAHRLPHHVEVLEVPPGQPRTKPKALAYALQVISGDFVVLYDAEDRPHPMQLMEAWHRFAKAAPDLACLQAPLEISNRHASAIARLFAFEYCGLFRGMLAWLSSRGTVLPLGGTSNHFRASSLAAVGGWDPYNVTEDADLGVRLVRCGYRTETLTLPTLEDGPETLAVWLPQRTRWFKGWVMTWLVHMRDPVALYRELGPRSFVVMQILSSGLVLSALVHPVLVATGIWIAAGLALGEELSVWQSGLLVFDIASITCGYAAFLALGWQNMTPPERKGFWRIVAFTPVYWLMLSWAAWRSLLHLWKRPHHWEKTPHFGVRE